VSPGRPLQRSREETRWAALNAALQLSCKVPPHGRIGALLMVPHGTDNAGRAGQNGGTTSSTFCCCEVTSSRLSRFSLTGSAVHERRAHALPGLRHASEHGSMIRPAPAGLQQADTHAVTTALGTIWGPHGACDPEQHARGRTSCTLVLPDMCR
jgi:hypothetical protein